MKTIEAKIPLHELVKDAVTVPDGVEYLPLLQWLMEKRKRSISLLGDGTFCAVEFPIGTDKFWESDTLIGLIHAMGLTKKPTA